MQNFGTNDTILITEFTNEDGCDPFTSGIVLKILEEVH